jgi:hypothetical protein
MIQMIEVQREDVLAFRIEGRIEKADIDALAEGVERRMKKYDRIRAYVEAGEITGIAVEAVFADLAFAFTHVWDVERKAVVSDDRWHQVLLEFAEQLFPSVDAKHFRPAERALALEWIQDGPDPRSLARTWMRASTGWSGVSGSRRSKRFQGSVTRVAR